MRKGTRGFLEAGAAALTVTLACGDAAAPGSAPRPAQPPVEEETIAEAPWERAWDDAERTAVVEGRVLTPTAAGFDSPFGPCDGAEVELWLPRPDGRALDRRVATARTGADGRFRVEGAVDESFAVVATKPGHARNVGGRGLGVFGALDLAASPDLEIAVLPARRLAGAVVDRTGAPVRGARIVATAVGCLAETTTDDAGAFAVDVPPGGVGLSLLDPRWDVVRTTAEVPPDGDVPPLRIVAAPVEPLCGTVVDAGDGRPLAGAVVTWMDEPGHATRTDADGRFVLPVPRTGRVAAFTRSRQGRSWAVPKAGEIVLRLREGAGISGRVVDARGRTIADARLLAVGRAWDAPAETIAGPRTDSGGRFDFSWAPEPPRGEKRPVFVVAWHRLRGMSEPLPLPCDGPRDLVLSGWRTVEGELRDDRGNPVPRAPVRAEWELRDLEPVEAAALGLPLRRETRTGPDGRFRLTDVPATFPVTVRADLGGLTLTHAVPAGSTVPLKLALPRGEPLEGRVLARGSRPPGAPGTVTVRLLDAPALSLERSATFGPDGVFRFEDVPPGRYHVQAAAEGFDLPGGCEARAGDREVVVVVERSASLRVRVEGDGSTDAATVPLLVWLDDLANTTVPARRLVLPPAPDGGVREVETRVHPGNWRVRVEGDVWRGTLEALALDDGEQRVETVRIEPTLRVRGSLRDGAGAPLPGVQVLFVPLASKTTTPVTTFSLGDGAIDVAGVRPGRWEVRVAPRLHAQLRVTVDLPAPGPLDLRLPPHGALDVRVRGAGGSALRGAIVSLSKPDGSDAFGWSEDLPNLASRFRVDDEGRARIVGLPVGDFRVQAAAGSARLGPVTATVRGGATSEVELALPSGPR